MGSSPNLAPLTMTRRPANAVDALAEVRICGGQELGKGPGIGHTGWMVFGPCRLPLNPWTSKGTARSGTR